MKLLTERAVPDADDPEMLVSYYIDGIAADRESKATEILKRCARIRREPPDRRIELLGPLLRDDWPQYPPELAEAVDDALFFVICGCERAEAAE